MVNILFMKEKEFYDSVHKYITEPDIRDAEKVWVLIFQRFCMLFLYHKIHRDLVESFVEDPRVDLFMNLVKSSECTHTTVKEFRKFIENTITWITDFQELMEQVDVPFLKHILYPRPPPLETRREGIPKRARRIYI